MSLRLRHRRDERGAVAVLVALLGVLLLSLAALGTDIGNQVTRRSDTQTQADFAALAAGQKMTAQGAVGQTPPAAIVTAAAAELNANQPQDDNVSAKACVKTKTCVQTSQLTDGSLANGEVRYTTLGLQVVAPRHWVSFGMARIMGFDGAYVSARATIKAGTPGAVSEMPFYAVKDGGCDWGQQALTDPAKGQVLDSNGVPVDLVQPTASPVPIAWNKFQSTNINTLNPTQVPWDSTGQATVSLSIIGTGLSKVTWVGFYRSGSVTPNKYQVPVTNPDSTGKTVTVTIPAGVISNADVWFVRVFVAGNNANNSGWSTQLLPLRVGDPMIVCPNLSSSGNFGALKLPRTDSTNSTSNGWMPNNIAGGLQKPLSISAFPTAPSTTCLDGQPNVIYSTVTGSPVLKPQTNCVDTDTGLTATATTSGLITGTPLFPNGRLTKASTSTGIYGSRNCAPGHSSNNRTLSIQSKSYTINNDTLTCFMKDPTMPISAIAKSSYNGGQVLDPSIYKSPRFCLVPVLKQKPIQGGSDNYWIIDVRACFITSEGNSSTWTNQVFDTSQGQATTDNGITLDKSSNRVETLDVVFFNHDALPNHGANIGDYLGVGPKAIQLVQ